MEWLLTIFQHTILIEGGGTEDVGGARRVTASIVNGRVNRGRLAKTSAEEVHIRHTGGRISKNMSRSYVITGNKTRRQMQYKRR